MICDRRHREGPKQEVTAREIVVSHAVSRVLSRGIKVALGKFQRQTALQLSRGYRADDMQLYGWEWVRIVFCPCLSALVLR